MTHDGLHMSYGTLRNLAITYVNKISKMIYQWVRYLRKKIT